MTRIRSTREPSHKRQTSLVLALDERLKAWEETPAQLQLDSGRRPVVASELSETLRRNVLAQESERQRIARELHDTLGQYLTAMNMWLEILDHNASAVPVLKSGVAEMKSLTAIVGKEVHRLAWELRPSVLDDIGLQEAIQQFVDEWVERSGISFHTHLALGKPRLPPIIETTFYRILQEAVTNVIKHAKAKRVGVILESTSRETVMIVEDDGIGFELGELNLIPSTHLGLLGMRERVALVGGSLEIESQLGIGTTLFVRVTLDGQAANPSR